MLATTRQKTLAALVNALGDYGGNTMVHLWERAAVRLYMGKPPLPEFVRLPCAKASIQVLGHPAGLPTPGPSGPRAPKPGRPGPGPHGRRPVSGPVRLALQPTAV